jgi:hypothetical protein
VKAKLDKVTPWNVDRSWIDELNPDEYRYYFPNPRQAEVPSIYRIPYMVDYSVRSPEEFVLSGPLGFHHGAPRKGPGRWYATVADAKVGVRALFVSVKELDGYYPDKELVDAGIATWPRRWAYLVRPL